MSSHRKTPGATLRANSFAKAWVIETGRWLLAVRELGILGHARVVGLARSRSIEPDLRLFTDDWQTFVFTADDSTSPADRAGCSPARGPLSRSPSRSAVRLTKARSAPSSGPTRRRRPPCGASSRVATSREVWAPWRSRLATVRAPEWPRTSRSSSGLRSDPATARRTTSKCPIIPAA
jgi:hypothetical protein